MNHNQAKEYILKFLDEQNLGEFNLNSFEISDYTNHKANVYTGEVEFVLDGDTEVTSDMFMISFYHTGKIEFEWC